MTKIVFTVGDKTFSNKVRSIKIRDISNSEWYDKTCNRTDAYEITDEFDVVVHSGVRQVDLVLHSFLEQQKLEQQYGKPYVLIDPEFDLLVDSTDYSTKTYKNGTREHLLLTLQHPFLCKEDPEGGHND